jgi:L-ascorbate metabolism protein UlaG (beta-lactamase superfamily)
MQLTKYEHACFTLEKDGHILVIDPGEFSSDFIAPEHVVGVVITHEHSDHFDNEQLTAIIDKNPEAVVVGPEAVTSRIEAFETKIATPGESIQVGNFTLDFSGGKHAVIHPSMPVVENIGVLINDLLYYPGDSLTLPAKPVDTLALPAAAPWLKTSEAMDFLAVIHPRLAFPTHDAILSEAGKSVTDAHLQAKADEINTTYQRLTSPITI